MCLKSPPFIKKVVNFTLPLKNEVGPMDHQGAPNVIFRHYTLKNSELAQNWPSSGPRLSRISTLAGNISAATLRYPGASQEVLPVQAHVCKTVEMSFLRNARFLLSLSRNTCRLCAFQSGKLQPTSLTKIYGRPSTIPQFIARYVWM